MRPTRAQTPAARPPAPSHARTPARFVMPRAVTETEEVAVFSRIRPLDDKDAASSSAAGAASTSSSDGADTPTRCLSVLADGRTLQLQPPVSSRAYAMTGGLRRTNYTFRSVFDEDADQRGVFHDTGLPLVRDLLRGRNGLLFTYGVTGSGKTHTMQGHPGDGGILPRAIDVLFNSLEGRLVSRKHVVVSDRLNDFQVQTVAEAAAMTQKEMMNNIRNGSSGRNQYGYNRNNTSDPNLSGRLPDESRVEDIDRNQVYAVFISYCEIYNKNIFDLLEDAKDPVTGRPKLTNLNLRKDNHGDMFVYGATEIEVRSPKEALEAFYRGQKRRRVANTQLNHESSRSHSIFNIRLVKCSPADEDEVDADKPCVVSQLALVDLAGSERTSRTGNTGDRLKEAGNINNSLMNLRACIEKLRENQKAGNRMGAGNVPYRNDKLTHLFSNYFEGVGSVKMIVCINPRVSDYDETLNVLAFAEVAQDIEIERREQPVQRDLAMSQSRQRAQQAFQDALNRQTTEVDAAKLNPAYSPIYNLGPAWPALDLKDVGDEETLANLERYLHQRVATRNTLVADYTEKCDQFRARLVDSEKELILSREEIHRLKAGWDGEKRRVRDVEKRLVNAESANTSLQRRVDAFCEQKVVLENELDDKELQLNHQKKETRRTVRKLKTQLSQEKDLAARKRSMGADDDDDDDGGDVPAYAGGGGGGGVGSRVAAMEARLGATPIASKRFRH